MSKNNQTKPKKETLCHYHHSIEAKTNELLEIDIAEYLDNPAATMLKIRTIADDIYNLEQKALSAGMSMEDRLKKYVLAIEKLGFERIRHG